MPIDQIDKVDTEFLKRCVSASVAELHCGESATNGATPSLFERLYLVEGREGDKLMLFKAQ